MRQPQSGAAPSASSAWGAVRVAVVLLLAACCGWMAFAISFHDDAENVDMDGIAGAMPGKPAVRRRRMHGSPAPVVKPRSRPAYVEWIDDTFNLRQCQCLKAWRDAPAGTSVCRCDAKCPPKVDPIFLTEAAGQSLCSLEHESGYKCYAQCKGEEDQEISWFASPCGGENQPECDKAILAGRKGNALAAAGKAADAAVAAAPAPAAADEAADAAVAAAPAPPPPAAAAPPISAELAAATEPEPVVEPGLGGSDVYAGVPLPYDPAIYIDLRGLQCELLNGTERCFMEDEQGRELCPPHVTSEYVSSPSDQYLCRPDNSAKYFCTVGCQEGNPEVRWGAQEVAWCSDPRNKGSCPERKAPIKRTEFKLQEWSEVPEPKQACRMAWEGGERPKKHIADLSVGLLTHEPRSFRDSMQTYEELGLFDVVSEFMIYINKRKPEVDAVAEDFAKRHKSIRIMGTSENVGILRGMNYLVGNATQPYFMFLERDFQLIEPSTCVVEQLEAGIKMLKAATAHVVRYRHKRHPGRPNWAARMFKGREDDVFKNGQPNLFCNHHYWYPEPEKRWPDKIKICNESPRMVCSDSFYCNWTNNPQIWSVAWWQKEYIANFANFKSNDPFYDIEVYMNWEPNSWGSRKWTVAQGEGLFKHTDRGNFGAV